MKWWHWLIFVAIPIYILIGVGFWLIGTIFATSWFNTVNQRGGILLWPKGLLPPAASEPSTAP